MESKIASFTRAAVIQPLCSIIVLNYSKHISRLQGYCLHAIVLLFLVVSNQACSIDRKQGIKKDFNTGLVSTYTNIEPESTWLEMNQEVLNHTDIPIGESFLLINENVMGLQEKDGKISTGCSLRIIEENGKVLLDEKDLFSGNDVFTKQETTRLKCTVNTGNPMEVDKNYKVQVVFWDKFGDGRIVNECTIKSIDMP